MLRRPRVLIIGGLDPSGGAGIAADIKTVSVLGGYAMPVLTAVTAQNTRGVSRVAPLEPALVADQIRAVTADIAPDAVKTGMLATRSIVAAVKQALSPLGGVPLVVDPVLVAGSGGALGEEDLPAAISALLIPQATVVTPNAPELAALTGRPVGGEEELRAAALALCKTTGAAAVYAKAGHLRGSVHRDYLIAGGGEVVFEAPHHPRAVGHGSGCTLASALATELARGRPLVEAAETAHRLVQSALRGADEELGGGAAPVDPLAWLGRSGS